jgi:thymidylate synthase (FAD)
MKLIKAKAEPVFQEDYDIVGIKKIIEKVGRICYKSEDKITSYSHIKFFKMLEDKKHYAMLEHGTVYLTLPFTNFSARKFYLNNKYSLHFANFSARTFYKDNKYPSVDKRNITTNYRVLIENNRLDDLKYTVEPSIFHEMRRSIKFTCNRSVSHEFVRSRGAWGNSFAQESTRYCSYNLDKFGNEVTYVLPSWWDDATPSEQERFKEDCRINEEQYFYWIKAGWEPQKARSVLNHALKTELAITAFESDWIDFFRLRCTPNAHPDAQQAANQARQVFTTCL